MKDWKDIALIIAVVAFGGLSLYTFLFKNGEDSTVSKGGIVLKERRINQEGKKRKIAHRADRKTRVSIRSILKEKEKPAFYIEEKEESKLTKGQLELLCAIRLALDDNDEKKVLQLVRKFQRSKEWPDGIPKPIKMAAIEALGWFGSSCIPEIAGFLSDGDQEVVKTAIEKYEEALADFELSDRERSFILVEAAKVINDADAMDSMLFELNNMRNSVKVDTIKKLLATARDATQSVLPDNIEFAIGEEWLGSSEKLDEWLEKNPDDEFDEEFYSGSSSD
jgi:hypothetical protein